jgi:Domain of unknown function (DUF4198)
VKVCVSLPHTLHHAFSLARRALRPFAGRLAAAAGLALMMGAAGPAAAHEFWFTPVAGPLAVGAPARLELRVGEYFEGVLVGFSAPQAVGLRHFSRAGERDLRALLPAAPAAEIALPLAAPGTHLIAYDSQPSQVELEAGRFQAYLHDEGLDFIQAQREAQGAAAQPGRERFRRHVKTLIAAGKPSAGDKTWATRTGQRLEIMPLQNPLLVRVGGALGVQVLFEGQPLAGALVKAWHRQEGQTLVIRARTSGDGQATFNLPHAGGWMVSVVHMVPAPGSDQAGGIDWDSLWGNLTFAVQAR